MPLVDTVSDDNRLFGYLQDFYDTDHPGNLIHPFG